MSRSLFLIASLALLAGCSSAPPAPDWEVGTQNALQGATIAWLAGNTRVADAEFTRARAEVSATGRADLLARTELVRCAARVAALEIDGCPAYRALAADAAPPERAYAAYIAGQLQGLDVAALPPQHRAVAAGGGTAAALPAVADPLARLVAAGALLQAQRLPPEGVQTAVDTASAQGWRRPLLAWLGVAARRAGEAGRSEEAARIQRRIDLIAREGAPVP